MSNISLIGMPGSGKSTIGVLLAKALGYQFIDTDLLLQSKMGLRLQEIIETYGDEGFLKLEEELVAGLETDRAVIATGGSVIFGEKAMARLHELGPICLLDVPVDELERRLGDFQTRGVVMRPGETVESLYERRIEHYRRFADYTVPCRESSMEQVVDALLRVLRT